MDLKPCPFCGDSATLYKIANINLSGEEDWHVTCDGNIFEECRGIDASELPGYTKKEYAIEAWNRRKADD